METIKIVTHDGIFHCDELFALAVLIIYFKKEKKKIEVIRARDTEKIALADIVVDVGGKYDPDKKRFDHHQASVDLVRENGIPYASFGLVWKHYGHKITSSKEVAEKIEQKLVLPVDALDNNIKLSTPITKGLSEYALHQTISAIGMAYGDNKLDKAFKKSLELAVLVLTGEIKRVELKLLGEIMVTNEIIKQGHPEYLVLEKYFAWDNAVSKYKNIKLVIFPDKSSTNWCIQTARDNGEDTVDDRIKFPVEWRGLEKKDLAEVSQIAGSVFCHKGGFFAVVTSKEDAISMAQKVVLKPPSPIK